MPITPPGIIPKTDTEWTRFFQECIVSTTEALVSDGALLARLSGAETITGAWTFSLPPRLPTYTVATLPSAATYDRGLIYVSNETGGATIAFSDGTNWRRVQDRAVCA